MNNTEKELRREQNNRWYIKKRAAKLALLPPDPLLLLPRETLAYMAGLLDGDGCFRIGYVGPKKRSYYPSISIGMTHKPTIEWVQSHWQSGSIKINNHTMLKRKAEWKTQWIVRIHGKRAQLLCSLLIPYLITKHEQALLIVAFPSDERHGPGNFISEEIQKRRTELFEQMRLLNRRGPLI